MTGSLAKRYARALAGVARDENRLEPVLGELERTAAWFADPELAAALASPALRADARSALLVRITASLELSESVRNFLMVLANNQRLSLFADVVRSYRRLVDQNLGRIRGVVRAPTEVPPDSLDELRAALEASLGKRVILSVETDRSLLGGLTVEIEGRVFDGSVRTQLAHLAQELARERSPG